MGASEALVAGSTPAEEIKSRPSFSGETGLKDYRGSTPHDELVHILSIRSECGATPQRYGVYGGIAVSIGVGRRMHSGMSKPKGSKKIKSQ